jgi:hypothetical protein
MIWAMARAAKINAGSHRRGGDARQAATRTTSPPVHAILNPIVTASSRTSMANEAEASARNAAAATPLTRAVVTIGKNKRAAVPGNAKSSTPNGPVTINVPIAAAALSNLCGDVAVILNLVLPGRRTPRRRSPVYGHGLLPSGDHRSLPPLLRSVRAIG